MITLKSDRPMCRIQLRMPNEKSQSFSVEMTNITLTELYNELIKTSSKLWRENENGQKDETTR